MTNIHGIPPPIALRPIDTTDAITTNSTRVEPPGISDTVEISDVAKLAARISEIPEVRTELIETVKTELAAGTYETSEKLEIAVERLLEDLLPEV